MVLHHTSRHYTFNKSFSNRTKITSTMNLINKLTCKSEIYLNFAFLRKLCLLADVYKTMKMLLFRSTLFVG